MASTWSGIVGSDAHLTGDLALEPCDREKLSALVDVAVARMVVELLLDGDFADVTRAGLGAIPAIVKALYDIVGRRCRQYRIRTTFVLGNHEGHYPERLHLARALYDAGFDPALTLVSTGPEFRGRWRIDHGDGYDPWCDPRSPLVSIGEMLSRLDYAADGVGIDIEKLNLATRHPADAVPELDWPVHRAANQDAARDGEWLVLGHSHYAYELRGEAHGRPGSPPWRVINCGALTKSAPFTFAYLTENDGRLVRG
jgi:hypothetical protein